MFAVRDQENLVHGHQQVAASKPLNQGTRGLQPKTPGNKYPKTPLKIPLNDENAPGGFGGKSGKGKGQENLATGGKKGATFDKNAFVTPVGPRLRAPLGMKTTNAKAKAFQTPAGPALEKELEKSQSKQTSTRKVKRVIHADSVKLDVHGDESPLRERDVEYCPPRPVDLPYESEDFPNNCIDYSVLKPENFLKDMRRKYQPKLDGNGMSELDRKYEEAYQKDIKEVDDAVARMMEEEWTVGDASETFRHLKKDRAQVEQPIKVAGPVKPSAAKPSNGPATVASRKAASALSVIPKSAPLQPKISKPAPKPSFLSRSKPASLAANSGTTSTMRHTAATTASKSTIGYNKGRSVPSILSRPTKTERSGLSRSTSNFSEASDTTITPARFANDQEWRNPSFLKAFEVDEEDLEPGLRGILPDCLKSGEEDEEEFVMTLGSTE